jgi:hypothetical protein
MLPLSFSAFDPFEKFQQMLKMSFCRGRPELLHQIEMTLMTISVMPAEAPNGSANASESWNPA